MYVADIRILYKTPVIGFYKQQPYLSFNGFAYLFFIRNCLWVEDSQTSFQVAILVAYMKIYSRTAITHILSFFNSRLTLTSRQLLQAITIYDAPVEIRGTHVKVAICIKNYTLRLFTIFFILFKRCKFTMVRRQNKTRDDVGDGENDLGR